jgi:periplasmic copper chaperone A
MNKSFSLLLIFTFLLAACAPSNGSKQTPLDAGEPAISQNGIEIFDPWVRAAAMNPGGGAVTGAFMFIKNTNTQVDMLLSAGSDAAADVQIHETTMSGGVMSMAEVTGVEIPAGAMVGLQPGGYHIMLIGLERELKAGDSIIIVLGFKNAGEIAVPVAVRMP